MKKIVSSLFLLLASGFASWICTAVSIYLCYSVNWKLGAATAIWWMGSMVDREGVRSAKAAAEIAVEMSKQIRQKDGK